MTLGLFPFNLLAPILTRTTYPWYTLAVIPPTQREEIRMKTWRLCGRGSCTSRGNEVRAKPVHSHDDIHAKSPICVGTLEMEMLASTFIDAGKLKNMSREEMQEYDMVRWRIAPHE